MWRTTPVYLEAHAPQGTLLFQQDLLANLMFFVG